MNKFISIAACLVISILCIPSSARAFSNFFIFGGSYSDAGTYLVPDADGSYVFNGQTFDQRRWTINPLKVWNQHIGGNYGFDIDANLVVDTTSNVNDPATQNNGGTNYAQGGAAVTGSGEYEYNTRSVADQIGLYLAGTGGNADPNALFAVEGGGNTIIRELRAAQNGDKTLAAALAVIAASAEATSDLSKALGDSGANSIMILNTNNLGATPAGDQFTPIDRVTVAGAVDLYNRTLLDALKSHNSTKFIYLDIHGLFVELGKPDGNYGFTNTTQAACLASITDAIFCTTDTLVAGADPNQYLWDGGLHPSGAGHIALGQYIQSILSAPGQYAYLAEVPLVLGQQIDQHFDNRTTRNRQTEEGFRFFADGLAGYIDLDGNEPGQGAKGAQGTILGGIEYADGANFLAGLMAGYSGGNFDFPNDFGQFDLNFYSASAYARATMGDLFVRAMGTYGWLNYDSIERRYALYQGSITQNGSTDGHYVSATVETGYTFNHGQFGITPTIALTYQNVDVNGYTESGHAWSTFTFEDQSRESLIGSVGAQVASTININGRDANLWFDAAYNHDFNAGSRSIVSGLTAAEGMLFSMPVDAGLEDWFSFSSGLETTVFQSANLSFNGGLRIGENGVDSLWGGARLSFALN